MPVSWDFPCGTSHTPKLQLCVVLGGGPPENCSLSSYSALTRTKVRRLEEMMYWGNSKLKCWARHSHKPSKCKQSWEAKDWKQLQWHMEQNACNARTTFRYMIRLKIMWLQAPWPCKIKMGYLSRQLVGWHSRPQVKRHGEPQLRGARA